MNKGNVTTQNQFCLSRYYTDYYVSYLKNLKSLIYCKKDKIELSHKLISFSNYIKFSMSYDKTISLKKIDDRAGQD